ncbi:MAG: LarC family nickel insertion protein [Granulosicoccus sp.]
MTRHIHLDMVGGIAGDMFVCAMLDLFPGIVANCFADLEKSGVLDYVTASLDDGECSGLVVKRFTVEVDCKQKRSVSLYRDLRAFLQGSRLDTQVKNRSLALLRQLAEAESTVHGVSIDNVHFHEVADWDSIADLVAASSIIERCEVATWSCSPVPLGSGQVNTEHGVLPVPAPAAIALLEGFEVCDDAESGERVTPTGAAILRHLMLDDDGNLFPQRARPGGTLRGAGVGAGQRILRDRPNILRCTLIQSHRQQFPHSVDEVYELTFAIDDMTPEELAVSIDHIRNTVGVLDVSSSPAIGKKGRAVFNVSILCSPESEERVSCVCFEQTTTLGIRLQLIKRRILHRNELVAKDDTGEAWVKFAERPGGGTGKVASDDLQRQPTLSARRERAWQLGELLKGRE